MTIQKENILVAQPFYMWTIYIYIYNQDENILSLKTIKNDMNMKIKLNLE